MMRAPDACAHPQSAACRNQGGFTLIEMVVALALVGMMSVAMIEALRFGQRSYEKVINTERAGWEVLSTQRFIRRLVESASVGSGAAGASSNSFAFEGGRDWMILNAPVPMAGQNDGLNHFELVLRPSRDGMQSKELVVRSRVDTAAPSSRQAAYSEELLLERVQGVQWSYLERIQVGGAAHFEWRDEWNNRPELPAMVRLRVEFASRDARRWPDLLVPIRVTHGSTCVFDVVAQDCRRSS